MAKPRNLLESLIAYLASRPLIAITLVQSYDTDLALLRYQLSLADRGMKLNS